NWQTCVIKGTRGTTKDRIRMIVGRSIPGRFGKLGRRVEPIATAGCLHDVTTKMEAQLGRHTIGTRDQGVIGRDAQRWVKRSYGTSWQDRTNRAGKKLQAL